MRNNEQKIETGIPFGGTEIQLSDIKWDLFNQKQGSMFDFFFGRVNGLRIAVGYGRRKKSVSGIRSDSEEFMHLCASDYEELLNNYPKTRFPYLMSEQALFYGNHHKDNKPTVICIRAYVDVLKDISSLKQADFIAYPGLKDELSLFFTSTRSNTTKPDIQGKDNLVVGRDGHLHLIDVNTLFTPGSGSQYNRIIRTQRAISYMLNGYGTFRDAYEEAMRHDLTP